MIDIVFAPTTFSLIVAFFMVAAAGLLFDIGLTKAREIRKKKCQKN